MLIDWPFQDLWSIYNCCGINLMKINYFSMAIIPTFKSIQMMAFINYSANVVSHFQPPYYCMSMPTIVMTFLVRECYGSPKKQEF